MEKTLKKLRPRKNIGCEDLYTKFSTSGLTLLSILHSKTIFGNRTEYQQNLRINDNPVKKKICYKIFNEEFNY